MSGFQELVTSYFYEEKPLYNVLRKLLNLLCSICLSSFFYKKFIGEYYLIDITDYQRLIQFFIDGLFIIPFIIFAITHYISGTGVAAGLEILNSFRSRKLQKRITKRGFKKEEINNIINVLKKVLVNSPISEDLNSEGLIKKYIDVKKENPNLITEIEKDSNEDLKNLSKNFETVLKFLITISILRNSIPYFDFKFYIFCFIISVVLLIIIFILYYFMETIPVLFQRLDFESKKYLDHQESKSNN